MWDAFAQKLLDAGYIAALASLVWPFALFFIALLFRKDISSLLKRLKRAKGFGGEIELEVGELRAQIEKAQEQPKDKIISVPTRDAAPPAGTTREQGGELEWKPVLFGETSLLAYPLNGRAVERLHKIAKEAPLEAVVLVWAQMESSIRELLAAKGISTKSVAGYDLGAKVVSAYGLSPAVAAAIGKFSALRNQIVHSEDRPPLETFSEVAELGLSLVELIERVPRDRVLIERAPLPVYRDPGCSSRLNEFMAVVLIFPAVPGATGHIDIRLTSAPTDYVANEWVSSEWGAGPDVDCWYQDPGGRPHKIPNPSILFIGKPYRKLMD